MTAPCPPYCTVSTPCSHPGAAAWAKAQPGPSPYYFYVDIAGHPDQDHVRQALEDLRKVCGFFKILGTYPVDVH